MSDELSGILLVDKPAGLTSQQVLTQLKKSHNLPRLGHAGTLDPFATGLLVVLVGKATRLQEFLLLNNKEYEGIILLGQRTDTDDVTGKILSQDGSASLPEPELGRRCSELEQLFSGTLQQIPPNFSAIHVAGKRAHERARCGEDLSELLTAREVTIHELQLSLLSPSRLQYRVNCSKGTYVRSLARDIGDALGCGACVESLRRTRSGELLVADAFALSSLLPDFNLLRQALLPGEVALAHLERWTFSDRDTALLRQGRQEPLTQLPHGGGAEVAGLFSESGLLIGVAHRVAGIGWRLRVNY